MGILVFDTSPLSHFARAGRARGVEVHGTLWLVAEALRTGLLPEADAITLVDALRQAEAWLPCGGRGFVGWARENGLL